MAKQIPKNSRNSSKDKRGNKLITLPCDVIDLSNLLALIQEQSELLYTPVLQKRREGRFQGQQNPIKMFYLRLGDIRMDYLLFSTTDQYAT